MHDKLFDFVNVKCRCTSKMFGTTSLRKHATFRCVYSRSVWMHYTSYTDSTSDPNTWHKCTANPSVGHILI